MNERMRNASMSSSTPLNYAPDRILIKFKAPQVSDAKNKFSLLSTPDTMNGVSVKSIRIINPSPSERLTTLSLANRSNQDRWAVVELSESGADSVTYAINRFANAEDIEYAERDYALKLYEEAETPALPGMCCGCLYGMRKIKAPQAWDITNLGENIVVGIIDTGIDITHPSLQSNIWENPNPGAAGYADDKYGYDFVNETGIDDSYKQNDSEGHGTHVAGTVGAAWNGLCSVVGVAPAVKLAAIKILDSDGRGNVSTAVAGINYASNMGFPITNNSYGNSGFYSDALREAVEGAGLFVVASGNDGIDADKQPMYPGCYGFDNIIHVAASDQNDEMAWFSNYGAKSVHLAAPGVDICSAHAMMGYVRTHGYYTQSGTSMACPHVAGAAALVLSALKGYDATKPGRDWIAEVKKRLLDNVDILPVLKGNTITGGRLNVYRAVTQSGKE